MPENNTQKISTTAKDYVEDRTGYRFVPSLEKLAEILKGDTRWPNDNYNYYKLTKNVSCLEFSCCDRRYSAHSTDI